MNELAEQEFAYVAKKLTTDELIQLDRRVVNGNITGGWYVKNDSCGCFFGSIGLIRGALGDDTTLSGGEVYRNNLLDGRQLEFVTKEGEFSWMTDLEKQIAEVGEGDTPDTAPGLRWLHGLLTAEIARRAPDHDPR
jgi:hypothetical protein